MQEAEELPAVDTREESPGRRLPQVAGTDSSSKETGDGEAKAWLRTSHQGEATSLPESWPAQ